MMMAKHKIMMEKQDMIIHMLMEARREMSVEENGNNAKSY